ncbi:pyridoxal 5'-phosphate synthase [Sugiyamaella lignohabitans]|uniref:Pyridoxal 5'-phosphate synthase n=1 Tax=Sugiyamaella lignohabitans TaxID=796027 RepID=A0A161HMI0_9ASCO|nr:pyridoxal 5'-phosphate synthase [Sugiyamaella lignohabitans]ANB14947.1 pyridoxal 5'-phosphate synthase [Sugiyamaella lignohabitans]
MTYTYIGPGDGEPYESDGVVIIATPKDTQKFENISSNPKVSLLLHDWVTARSLGAAKQGSTTTTANSITTDRAGDGQHLSGLAQFLQDLNQSELSSISATFSGHAVILEPGSDKEKFFRDKHMAAHTADARCFFHDAAIVAVKVQTVTVADSHNRVTRNSVSS